MCVLDARSRFKVSVAWGMIRCHLFFGNVGETELSPEMKCALYVCMERSAHRERCTCSGAICTECALEWSLVMKPGGFRYRICVFVM